MTLKKEFTAQGNWLFRFRSFLPIIIILPGLYLFISSDDSVSTYISNYKIGLSISLIGVVIRAIAVGYSAPNTSGRNTKGQVADSINTTGIYSLNRHPLYLGNYLMWLGLAVFTGHIWFCVVFTLLFWLYYERIMYAEEDYLINKFGTPYEIWAKKTPAFIPKFSNWKKSERQYSWQKVIYQEKSTWLNLTIVFALFLLLRDLYKNNKFDQLTKFSFTVLGVVLFYYLIVKIIQKNSK